MDYPLLFEPIYKDYIWGGRKLEKIGKVLPAGNTAESWEIACHPDGTGLIRNGKYKGMSLQDLIDEYGPGLLGTDVYKRFGSKFPLLIKLIDANRDLSVQVHPDDEYARMNENGELGKNEMWIVVDSKPGSRLVSGMTDGVTRKSFEDSITGGRVMDCLNFVETHPGDCFNIPAGFVHAIGEGNLICEIQQNSNTTYRVYDYDRTDDNGNKRPLHVKKALDVIDFSKRDKVYYKGLAMDDGNAERTFLVANGYFATERISFDGVFVQDTEGERFHCYTVLNGEMKIEGTKIAKAHSCLIPADVGKYMVKGKGTVIKSYVPDLDKNVIKPLMEAGYSRKQIEEAIL